MSSHVGRPPCINQLGAVLPDGSIDPDATTDCGEANMSAIWSVKSGLYFSPGCIRIAIGTGSQSGVTNGVELQDFLIQMGMEAKYRQSVSSGAAWTDLYNLRHFGRYAVLLGTWSGPEGHWVLAYEHHPKLIWAMNSWGGFYDSINQQRFDSQFWGEYVDVYF
jgi:hypothetical protein